MRCVLLQSFRTPFERISLDFKHLLSFLLIASGIFCSQTCKNSVAPPPQSESTDTTSHSFIIARIDTLGDLFSFARAVYVIDENNIWVGGIAAIKSCTTRTSHIGMALSVRS